MTDPRAGRLTHVEALDGGLRRHTCACGWSTSWGDIETARENMRLHRIGCTAVTSRG